METLDSGRICGLEGRLVCAFAPVSAGKTELILDKVCVLAKAGRDLSQTLVAVNSAEQARAFRRALRERGLEGEGLRVETPLEALLGELALRGARPRLLVRSEFNVVLEDLKREGFEPAAIRPALAALLRNFAGGVQDPWRALPEASRAVCDRLASLLGDLGATMREEVPSLVLRGSACGTRAPRFEYVLVDDAQNLSLATLEALASLASRQVLAVGNPLQAIAGFDPGFSGGAFEALLGTEGAVAVELAGESGATPAASSAAQALCGFGNEGSEFFRPAPEVDERDREALLHIKWREPSDEVAGVCRIVARLLCGDPDLLPRDVAIAVPNRVWAAKVEAELARRRIPFQTLLDDDPVAGDPRSSERLGTLEAYATLALAADPEDPAAWRFWLALGRADFGCPLWEALRRLCKEKVLSLRDAVSAVAAGEVPAGPAGEELRARVEQAFDALRGIEGKRGFALRNHFCHAGRDPRIAAIFEFFDGGEDAAGLFCALQGLSLSPSFADRPSQVCVGSYRSVSTLSPRHVLAPGLVEGVMPVAEADPSSPAARRRRDMQRRLLGCASGVAKESLTLCSFQRAEAREAVEGGLPVRRTRRYQGREVAVFLRSSFFDDAGESVSGSVSGEQYFIDE